MIHFVTGNEHKWREIEAILANDCGIAIKRANIDLPESQGASLEEIARKKAVAAHQLLSAPVLVEDTALCFDAFNGLPGAYIKWFLEAMGVEKLPRMLDGFGEMRGAEAVCTLIYYDGSEFKTFQGRTRGHIAQTPLGPASFGWDPIFVPESSQLSYAQMSPTEKNKISHRARALQQLKAFFLRD